MFAKLLSSFILGFAFFQNSLFAATTASSTVTYTVLPIDVISVNGGNGGNPSPFNVTTAIAGSQPISVSDSTTTLAITTNSTVNRTVSAQLSSAMPIGVTFTVNVAAGSSGGTSFGAVNVADGAPHNLVTGITQVAADNMTITYKFSVTVTAPITASTNMTLTYTLS